MDSKYHVIQKKKSDFSNNSSKSVTKANNTQLTNATDASSYDPNKTVQGVEVTQTMIDSVRNELTSAGLPANEWGPSDIKKNYNRVISTKCVGC